MVRVALVQMTSGPEPAGNLESLAGLLAGLPPGVDLVLTPENTLVLGGTEAYRSAAEPLGEGPSQAALAGLARRCGSWLSVGSHPIRAADGRVHATTLVFDAQGTRRAHYEKLHLFDVEVAGDRGGEPYRYMESDAFAPGGREVVVETPAGRVGLAICYDLRFPGLFTRLRGAGAQLLAVPAAFTRTTGEAHWEVLLRARAIETQCFVLAPAQVGTHPDGRETYGHSMVVDPWGRILDRAPAGPGLRVVELDLARLDEVRARMPLALHARHRVGPPGD